MILNTKYGKSCKIHCVSWDNMCAAKGEGGICFKDLKTFNMNLLAKQGWGTLNEESSLLHNIFKAKYFPHTTFMDSKLGV